MKKIFSILLLLMAVTASAQNKATDSLKRAIKVAKEDAAKVDLLHDLCSQYMWWAADSAIIYARQGQQLAQKINDNVGIGYSLLNLCDASTELGNYPQAVDYGFKALSVFNKLKDTLGIINANCGLTLCYRHQGNYKRSLVYVHDALHLAERIHVHKTTLSTMWGIISSVYEKDNQLDSALVYAKKSFEYEKHWSGLLYVLGSIYTKKGNDELALQYYKKTIAMAEENNTLVDIVDAYNGISRVYIGNGKTDSAIYYAKKALLQKLGNTYALGASESATLLANIYQKKKITDSTLKYLKLTIGIKDSLYSRQKEREVQNIAFNEQLNQQELQKQQEQAENRLKMYTLIAVLFGFLVISVLQWRNNRNRQQAYNLLQNQKQETDLQKAKAEYTLGELVSANKEMEAFSYSISHDLRAPLRAVNGYAQMLKEDYERSLGPEGRRVVGKIMEQAKKMGQLIDDLLAFSRLGRKELANTDIQVQDIVENICNEFESNNRDRNIEFRIGKLQSAIGDSIAIRQVWFNLISNAVKYTGQKEKAIIEIGSEIKNDEIIFYIKDNGAGFDMQYAGKLFGVFQRLHADEEFEGTGVGLAIAHRIISKHGGRIWAEAKVNEGAAFFFTLT